jgi:lipoate-protein ligase A
MAAEEYLLNSFTDEIFMLWQNDWTVVVGQYQNTLAEINLDFVKEKNVNVVRRLTGGGAVFHDAGNLNFTFIKNGVEPDFQRFTMPIIEALKNLGVDARFEGRNDISVDGKKVSGNAMLVSGKRILEHGTLLFSSKIENLSAALKTSPLKFEDKAVKSVRSRVANISDYLSSPMTVLDFRDEIMKYMFKNVSDCVNYSLDEKDIAAITELRNSKYATWDWNYGKSPDYAFSKTVRTSGGNVEIHLNTNKGVITGLKIYGDFFGDNISHFESQFIGCQHSQTAILAKLNEINPEKYIVNVRPEELIAGFF